MGAAICFIQQKSSKGLFKGYFTAILFQAIFLQLNTYCAIMLKGLGVCVSGFVTNNVCFFIASNNVAMETFENAIHDIYCYILILPLCPPRKHC